MEAVVLVWVDKCGRYCQGVENEKKTERERERETDLLPPPPPPHCKSDRTQYQSINQKEIDKSNGSRNFVRCIFERGHVEGRGCLWPIFSSAFLTLLFRN
jgi:hypothetical protein